MSNLNVDLKFGKETCGNLETAFVREWLETNGLGGYASSTIIGLNSRRYHGLLVAATHLGRYVLLSKVEETLRIDGDAYDLSTNQYPGVIHPQGFQYQIGFRLDPFPVFTYEVAGMRIEKSVFMLQGKNSTVIRYELKQDNHTESPKNIRLEVRPLIAFRGYHNTTHENSALSENVEIRPGMATVAPYAGLTPLHIAHDAIELRKTGHWYRRFEYRVERERGLDFAEDLFNPLILDFDLNLQPYASLVASTEEHEISHVEEYRRDEIERRNNVARSFPVKDPFAQKLAMAADQFIISREGHKTVIAGYHWFTDWGRDTMIALPGLTLVTGRHEVAQDILRRFARHVDQGMLPNRFPDGGEKPEYNTVDATLWFFEAARAYIAASGDYHFVQNELYPAFIDIMNWHIRGTRHGIKVDSDGLLLAGEAGVQLTWMDAKVGDWVVTPRQGKPVEIQALWYNALCIMADLARQFADETGQKRFRAMAALASRSFNALFWNREAGCLYDVVDGDTLDPSIRPNQVFAASLPHSLLSSERAKAVVEKIREHLLTPYGLRTLAPGDPQYRGHYVGGPHERDGAYHQGTVWPWLLAPFINAYIKANGKTDVVREQVSQWLAPLKAFAESQGVGQIPEIFEGDTPHRPCGCIAQAWSVAEILRVYAESGALLRN